MTSGVILIKSEIRVNPKGPFYLWDLDLLTYNSVIGKKDDMKKSYRIEIIAHSEFEDNKDIKNELSRLVYRLNSGENLNILQEWKRIFPNQIYQ